MRRVLRAIAGLPHDTAVLVERRVAIGRAADCDLQLGDPEVSRRHAKIEIDADDQAVLVDLSSKTGTFVGGTRIDRHVLTSGDEIAIGRFRLRYDEVAEPVAERRPPAKRGMEVLRQTIRFEVGSHPAATEAATASPPPPPPPRTTSNDPRTTARTTGNAPRVTSNAPRVTGTAPRASATAPRVTGTAPVAERPATPARPRTLTGTPAMMHRDETARIVVPSVPRLASSVMPRAPRQAIAQDEAEPEADAATAGVPHPITDRAPAPVAREVLLLDVDPMVVRAEAMGLVRAVFDYRLLRLQQLRHEILDHDELSRLDELENQLEHRTGRGHADLSRRYKRFGCAVPAWIAVYDGRRISTASIALEDISAGGAQLSATDLLAPGDACWLVVDLENEDPDPVVVFGARVVWSTPADHRMGLVFSGNVQSGIDGVGLVRSEVGL